MTPDAAHIHQILTRWHTRHRYHPGLSELAIYAISGIGPQRTRTALHQLAEDGLVICRHNRWDPHDRRWAPRTEGR